MLEKMCWPQYPASKKIFFKEGRPLKLGERLVQKDLGRVISDIAKYGEKVFYQGWIAKAIVRESQRLGGLLQKRDFRAYDVKWRKPVRGNL